MGMEVLSSVDPFLSNSGGLLAGTEAGKLPSDPVNSYRLSPWWENLREVLRPRSQRPPKAVEGGAEVDERIGKKGQ